MTAAPAAAPRVTCLAVQPTGRTSGAGFVLRAGADACTLERLDLPRYPHSPNGQMLRVMRTQCEVSMGDAARALGIRASDLSDLEHGHQTLSDQDWLLALRVVAALYEQEHPRTSLILENPTEVLDAS